MTVKLTRGVVGSIRAPAKGTKLLRDSEVMGFGVRFQAATKRSPEGVRSFFFNYHVGGQERRIAIGQYPTWSCDAARERAKELRREVDRGGDPAVEKRERREAPTVADLAERYRTGHLLTKSKKSQKEDWRIIETKILPKLRNRKVAEVHYGDMAALHKSITDAGTPIRANRVLAVASKMFSVSLKPMEGEARAWRTADVGNPCKGIVKNPEEGRERFYSTAELAAIGDALNEYRGQAAADCVRFVMLTGARPQEARYATWDQVDKEPGIWVKPSSHTKQRKVHRVPLSPPALELIERRRKERGESPYIFPGRKGPIDNLQRIWKFVVKRTGLKNSRPYDLRHSFASLAAAGGSSLLVIGKLLGHANPKTTQRYVHLFDDPLREATTKIGATITQERRAQVISIKRKTS